MSFEVGKQALDFLMDHSGSRTNLEVDFFGGEPLMNWDVVKQLVEYARSVEKAVSYTHLDVYKRQKLHDEIRQEHEAMKGIRAKDAEKRSAHHK